MYIEAMYIDSEDKDKLPKEFVDKWNAWLNANLDPGHYDAYKDKTTNPTTWRTDIYLPEHLREEFKRLFNAIGG